MKKKRAIKINLSNKLFYTLIVFGVVVLMGVGVYALVNTVPAGQTPNPGHNMGDIGAPSGCSQGDYLQFYSYETPGGGSQYVWQCNTPSIPLIEGTIKSLPPSGVGSTGNYWMSPYITGTGTTTKTIDANDYGVPNGASAVLISATLDRKCSNLNVQGEVRFKNPSNNAFVNVLNSNNIQSSSICTDHFVSYSDGQFIVFLDTLGQFEVEVQTTSHASGVHDISDWFDGLKIYFLGYFD